MSSRVVSTLVSEDHAEAVAAFTREVWTPQATADSVIAARRRAASENVAEPGRVPPTAIVLRGDRVIGYCSTIAQRLWDGTTQRPGYWVKGFMVLPEFRGGPVGFQVMKELSAHLDLSTILTVAPAARRLFVACGFLDLGAVPNWVRPLRLGRLLRQLDPDQLGTRVLSRPLVTGLRTTQRTGIAGILGAGIGTAIRGAAWAARLSARQVATSSDAVPPGRVELDSLWEQARRKLLASPVRDSVYLLSRYLNGRASESYQFLRAHEGNTLVGVAVLRRPRETSDPRLGGARVATVSDIVFPLDRSGVGLALLGAAEREASRIGADAVLCTSAHPRLVTLLRRQGYMAASANVHFLLRDRAVAAHWPSSLQSWWLARGDGESDEVF
jgi:GNAT superfamily N-acetyltransferase